MSENGYFHQNKAISTVIKVVFLCSSLPQIIKAYRTYASLGIREPDKGIALAELKQHFIVRLFFDR